MATEKSKVRAAPIPKARTYIGTEGMALYHDIINRLQPYELRYPQCLKTYEAMKTDDAIATVLKLNYNLIEAAFAKQKVVYNKRSLKSRKAAQLVQYCLNNLKGKSYMQIIRGIETFKEKGFSLVEKTYTLEEDGEFAGYWTVDLGYRPQLSLNTVVPFEISNGGRQLKAVRQNTGFFVNKYEDNYFVNANDITGEGYKRIPRAKFMLFGENATDATPFGTPIFRACYKAWKEKLLLEDLEINGASKDLAGIIEVAVPLDILEKAAKDPASPEASMLDDLLAAAANIHSGEQAYIVRPSDVQEKATSVPEYSTRLLGLEGSGKQFSTSEMIQSRRRAIFDIWGAGHVLTGEGSVSYNSAEVKNAIHMHYIEADIKVIEDVFNNDLIPQLINDFNEMGLSYEDLPKIQAGEVDRLSYDEAGKLIQRAMAVNGIALTKQNIIHMHHLMGFPEESIREMENMSEDELIDAMNALGAAQSKAASGMTSGLNNGTGTSTAKGADTSTANKEHAEVDPTNYTTGIHLNSKGFYRIIDGDVTYLSRSEIPEELLSIWEEE